MNATGQEENNNNNNKLPSRTKTFFRDEVIFDSDFDSANLSAVVEIPKSEFDYEFNLWTAPDCAGTEYENANRSWFYFGVRGGCPGGKMLLNIINLNRQIKLYQQGMTAVFRQRGGWERMKERPTFEMCDWGMRLSFFHVIPTNSKLTTYYAFCYPHSYTDCQRKLERIENTLTKPEYEHIYYNRELMVPSLDGRRVDLITVTSYSGITEEREPRINGLFPSDELRPNVFQGKKVYVLSSRVHPGEVTASHIFNGFLDFILNPEDLRAQRLRDKFVFKLVPMLNPDGVARGHYRMDQRGANLNRYYLDPDPTLHPSIFALRSVILHHHNRGMLTARKTRDPPFVHFRLDTRESSSPPLPVETDPLITQENSGIAVYVDLHGHASRRGCFIYGNHFDDVTAQTENMLYPKLISLNSPNFDFGYCLFSEKNMYWKDKKDGLSKEGSGRVGIYKATGIIRSYTLECNYNTGRLYNAIPPADPSGRSTPPHPLNYPPKFTISVMEELGKSLAISTLDLYECNPWSRLKKSQYSNLHGLKMHITDQIMNSRELSSGSLSSCYHKTWDNRAKLSVRNGMSNSYTPEIEIPPLQSKVSFSSRGSSKSLGANYIPFANPVAKQMNQYFEEATKSSLFISKSKLSSLLHSELPSNESKLKLCNPTTYKQFEIRNVSRRVSDGERPLSEAAATCKRGLTGRKERAPVSRGAVTRNLKSFSDQVTDLSPNKSTSLVLGLDLATLLPVNQTPPVYPPSPYSPIKSSNKLKQSLIVKERSKHEENILLTDGIEGKEFVDKHFSSEEIKLVKRLPKTLQNRALKCLKEQKMICESNKSIEAISEPEKKSKSRSKIRSSPLSAIQPIATRVTKASTSNPARKKVNNKQFSQV